MLQIGHGTKGTQTLVRDLCLSQVQLVQVEFVTEYADSSIINLHGRNIAEAHGYRSGQALQLETHSSGQS